MDASNNPTTWFLEHPDPLATGPVLPPGLALAEITPEAATTYLPDRVIPEPPTSRSVPAYDVKVSAANITGFSAPKYVRFVVIPPDPPTDPYTQWANFYWLPFAWCMPAANGSADAEGDGGVNVAEFALGTSPVAFDFPTATSFSSGCDGQMELQLPSVPDPGVKYEFQVSDSLATDSWVTMVVSDPAVADGVPASGDPAFSVSEGPIIPAGEEPQSERRLITVTTGPEDRRTFTSVSNSPPRARHSTRSRVVLKESDGFLRIILTWPLVATSSVSSPAAPSPSHSSPRPIHRQQPPCLIIAAPT